MTDERREPRSFAGNEELPRAEILPRLSPNGDGTGAGTGRPAWRVETARVVEHPRPSVVRAAPELARVAALSAWQVFSWSLGATIAGANYVARRAADGENAATILQGAVTDLRDAAWRALGVENTERAEAMSHHAEPPVPSAADLQRKGAELLRQSNDVTVAEDTHPAFARILTEITPDEARVLRFMYRDGPQPAIDVRTYRPFGVGSGLVVGGLNMIGEHAGCRHLDRIHPYLTNLSRLGLVEFSKEQVADPQRYQVIEAQPKAVEAVRKAGRMPRVIHRRIALTTFGLEFVRVCLPVDGQVVSPPPPSAGDGWE